MAIIVPVVSDIEMPTQDGYRPMGTRGILDPEVAVVCLLCGGVVSSVEINTHTDWHTALSAVIV